MINIKKTVFLFCFIGFYQIILGDGTQESIDFNYLRTPEASAFKKYGEESVNEYTGTADISVPLYTIKCKDIEIPIVLRYDASGIKVEQEASWVGLGWNLMVGGCINYVCAGGHDRQTAANVPNKVWTEYLSSDFSPWTDGLAINGGIFNSNNPVYRSRTMYYSYNPNDTFNWMSKLPCGEQNFIRSYIDHFSGENGMYDYIRNGYGERDFYSVNVMGKSFMFFIDPATLKVFKIGKAGEDFLVYPIYSSYPQKGIGKQPDADGFKIIDSDGYVYHFGVGDKCQWDSRTGLFYTSCWYLTKIQTRIGETIEFEYLDMRKSPRKVYSESNKVVNIHDNGNVCCGNAIKSGYDVYTLNENSNMDITTHYLKEIRTPNQTVSFITSDCDENSGKRLDSITAKSNDGNLIKTVKLTYGSFGHSNIGGKYVNDPSYRSENRLKLENVKEIALADTLTTSFFYNETKLLPSKRSSAQDFWGYYNGKNNNISGRGYSLVPAPCKFMSSNYRSEFKTEEGADRFCKGTYMQAAILNKVVYPTGGYTTFKYEPNSILTNDFTLTEKYREQHYDVRLSTSFSGSYTPLGYTETGSRRIEFEITEDAVCDLLLTSGGDSLIIGDNLTIEICKWNEEVQMYNQIQVVNVAFQNYMDYHVVLQGIDFSVGSYYIGTTLFNKTECQYGYTCYLKGWYKNARSCQSYPLECGGLRIAKICNYDGNGSLSNYITYDYRGGVLLNKIETIDYASLFNFRPNNDPINGNVADLTHNIEVYTINTGHPRMPAFFASCNPGIVGYSYVTKNNYDANDILEKKIVSSYTNREPVHMYGVDFYSLLDNGLLNSQEIYDSSNTLVLKTINSYDREIVDHYATNMITKDKSINGGDGNCASYTEYQTIYRNDGTTYTQTVNLPVGGTSGVVDVLCYPYILSRVNLSKSTIYEYCGDGSAIISTKKYHYNNINNEISRIEEFIGKENNNSGSEDYQIKQVLQKEFKYSVDKTNEDFICNIMVNNSHMLRELVERTDSLIEDGRKNRLNTRKTTYNITDTINEVICYLPSCDSVSIGNNRIETCTKYKYDDRNNICSIESDSIETVYLWSYNGQYPIAKIEGLSYDRFIAILGESEMNRLLNLAEPSESDYSTIREKINNAGGLITTYTYKPLIGISSQTLPDGTVTKYEYDAFGRLETIRDADGQIISSYKYKYQN